MKNLVIKIVCILVALITNLSGTNNFVNAGKF